MHLRESSKLSYLKAYMVSRTEKGKRGRRRGVAVEEHILGICIAKRGAR